MIYLSLTHYFYLILLQFGSLHFISLRLTRTQTGGHFLIVYCLLALELKFRLNNRRDFGFPLIRKGYSTSINFASKKRYLLLFSRRPSPVVRGAWYQRTIENEKSNSDNKKTRTRPFDEHTKQISSFFQSFVRSRYSTLPTIPRRISFFDSFLPVLARYPSTSRQWHLHPHCTRTCRVIQTVIWHRHWEIIIIIIIRTLITTTINNTSNNNHNSFNQIRLIQRLRRDMIEI